MVIIDDHGFRKQPDETRTHSIADALAKAGQDAPLEACAALTIDVALPVAEYAHRVGAVSLLIVPFAGFGDGRGFSIAMELRRAGFGGRLRASGHLIPDQYAHARRCGFDEVAISDEQARRQPESQWLAEIPKIPRTYQKRLGQAAHTA